MVYLDFQGFSPSFHGLRLEVDHVNWSRDQFVSEIYNVLGELVRYAGSKEFFLRATFFRQRSVF